MDGEKITIRPKGHKPYPLLIGKGVMQEVKKHLPDEPAGVVLISDDTVAPLFGDHLIPERSRFFRIVFPAGEKSKCREEKNRIEDEILAHGMGRDTQIVALGGGVTTDLAGFVASTFMRGVPSLLVPTTLLAMVDAAIGGKTGINIPAGKNLIGAFHHPRAVIADLECLKTLAQEEVLNGVAEMAKAGVIGDPELFEALKRIHKTSSPLPFFRSLEEARNLVFKSAALKADVVSRDPLESGFRQVLNFGHTFGHAIERASGYALSHGSAVAAGMHMECLLAEKARLLSPHDRREIQQGLLSMGLDLKALGQVNKKDLLPAMTMDKKNRGHQIRFALPIRLGEMAAGADHSYSIPIRPSLVEEVVKGIQP